MDDLVDVVHVDLAGLVALDRVGDALDGICELRFVIGRDQRPGDTPSRLRDRILARCHRAGA